MANVNLIHRHMAILKAVINEIEIEKKLEIFPHSSSSKFSRFTYISLSKSKLILVSIHQNYIFIQTTTVMILGKCQLTYPHRVT